MKRVLVTGGAGAIGSRLVAHLCQDYRVLVLDDLSSGWYDNIRGLPVRFWRGSVVDDEILKEVFGERPAVVFHLAANFANQNSVDYPQKDLTVNGLGTLKVLQYAREADVERFVYASSSCVYGDMEGPISEATRDYSLDTPYAITKLLGEQYVRFFRERYAMATVILRFFNSFGPGEYPGKYRNVIPNFMYRMLTDQALIITGTGEETRDFTFVDDTVIGLMLAMSLPEAVGHTFNVGTGQEITIRQLAEEIQGACGVTVSIDYRPRRDWDSVTHRCADISRIRKRLGYVPTVDLATGLARTYRWFVEKDITRMQLG